MPPFQLRSPPLPPSDANRNQANDGKAAILENCETCDGAEFLRQVRESRFLFSKEISIYLDGIHKDWLIYLGIKRQFKDPQTTPEEPDFSKLSREKGDIALRLKFDGPKIATEKFAKEMSLTKI